MITSTYQPDNGGAYKITSFKEGDYIIAVLWYYNGGGVALRHKCTSTFNGDFIEATTEEVKEKMSINTRDAAHIADYINSYMMEKAALKNITRQPRTLTSRNKTA